MHYETMFIALFATTAFAKAPWVSSFYNADCTGAGAGDAVSVSSYTCAPFDSTYNAVAVNFGTNLDEITSVSVFTDADCQIPAGADITAIMADNTPQQCISQSAHGKKWGSVMQT